jgi:LysM repeat protein
MDLWNKPGVEKCVHAFIEPDGDVFQTLPWDHRGWHGGGASNNTYIGVEMTEPATIKYTGHGAEWKDLDPVKTKEHVLATYKVSVELFADLCEEFKLDPLLDGVIISHNEGNKRGIASSHVDVEHIWNKVGLTMDKFRNDVKILMEASSKATSKPKSKEDIQVKSIPKSYQVKPGDTLGAIATTHHTTVAKLIALNRIMNANQISVGQIIKLV